MLIFFAPPGVIFNKIFFTKEDRKVKNEASILHGARLPGGRSHIEGLM
jgi:hypothetical protein